MVMVVRSRVDTDTDTDTSDRHSNDVGVTRRQVSSYPTPAKTKLNGLHFRSEIIIARICYRFGSRGAKIISLPGGEGQTESQTA
jgi:hypothetical protein